MEGWGMSGKIFYRERRNVQDGEKKPRFRVVVVLDCNLKVYSDHLRLSELTHLAEETGAELVHLRKGSKQEGTSEQQ
jgi:hypothetical protein